MHGVAQLGVLRCEEQFQFDPSHIVVLFVEYGSRGAEQLIAETMEEIAVRLVAIEHGLRDQRTADLIADVRALAELARRVGLTGLRMVAEDLETCLPRQGAARDAVAARLMRVGERSLTAIWDLENIRP